MDFVIPKFCATCVDDDFFYFSGAGDTPEEAFSDFMQNGGFMEQCRSWVATCGEDIDVYIFSVIDINNSDWAIEDREPSWKWCLDEKVETRTVKAKYDEKK